MDLWKSIQKRRSNYALTPKSDLPRDSIEKIVHDTLFYLPSAFNMQSARAAVLFGDSHTALWDITRDVLRAQINDEEAWKTTEKKIAGFASGFGTILYYLDNDVVQRYKKEFPLYASHFGDWAMQEAGMVQFAIWTALSANGLGASLQHYNPLIDERTRQRFNVEKHWQLIGQMPFGKPEELPKYRAFPPVGEHLLVRG